MLIAFWQKLDLGLRWLVPLVTTLLFILGGIITWPLPYLGTIAPALGLVAIYYWSAYRPDLFSPASAFIAGIFHDAVNNLPLGTSALIYVVVHQLTLGQRRFFVGHSFFMFWSGFCLMMLVAFAIEWVVLSIWSGQTVPLVPPLLQAVLTIGFFPLPAGLLIAVQRHLLSQN